MRSFTAVRIAASVIVVGWASASLAHDYWIHPAQFEMQVSSEASIRLFVGKPGEIVEQPYNERVAKRFELHGPSGVSALRGKNHHRPAANLVASEAGIYTVAFQTGHTYIELESSKFESYLHKEGLDDIIKDRKRRGESEKPGLESYFRNCKSLVRVGDGKTGWDKVVDLPFEITARNNPFAAHAGDKLQFALAFGGKPLAGAQVELFALSDLSLHQTAHTNARGLVTLRVPASGQWMVAATQMRRAPASVKGDWESFWATLTFEVPTTAH